MTGYSHDDFADVARTFRRQLQRTNGGAAVSVHHRGEPVIDLWGGVRDLDAPDGPARWEHDTVAMCFSTTKGVASTAVHVLADRGLVDYDEPVATYWPEFAQHGKEAVTVRHVLTHSAGLHRIRSLVGDAHRMLDWDHMCEALAAATPAYPPGTRHGYHALTYGWLLSGLARVVTGKGMRELMRTEVAEPLNTDGVHLGRPPAGAPTQAARFVGSQMNIPNPVFNALAPAVAGLELSAAFGAMYVPGVKKLVQRDVPLLDTELPSANGVITARALARMYGALAHGGMIDGRRYFSAERVTMLTGRRNLRPDRNLIVPLAFHLGYHGRPSPGVLPGFGHVGLAGSFGWAVPEEGLAFSLVHNRLLTPLVMTDQTGFVGTAALVRLGAASARKRGFTPVVESGSTYDSTLLGAVAG